jgi:hypothetical protein
MPYTQDEYKRKKAAEMGKWDALLNQGKISSKDYLRHMDEFEAEHQEEEARMRDENRMKAYSQGTLQRESLFVSGKETVGNG